MLWVFIGLLGGFAFVFLTRLFWADRPDQPDGKTAPSQSAVTLAIIILAVALLVMIATGRLNWISALITGAIPFLRRIVSLLRFIPVLGPLLGPLVERVLPSSLKGVLENLFGKSSTTSRSMPPEGTGSLTVAQARQMLEVADHASKAEIVAAHRRLMARNHPDRGGSNYIAAQLTHAKDLLLKNLE